MALWLLRRLRKGFLLFTKHKLFNLAMSFLTPRGVMPFFSAGSTPLLYLSK